MACFRSLAVPGRGVHQAGSMSVSWQWPGPGPGTRGRCHACSTVPVSYEENQKEQERGEIVLFV